MDIFLIVGPAIFESCLIIYFSGTHANDFPTDSMYDEDSNADSIRRKCDESHEIKESDENWFECWTQDDSGDELGFDYLEEGP